MFFRGEFTRPDFSLMARSRRRLIIEQLGIVHRKEDIGNEMVGWAVLISTSLRR
jgi:hypothetical protein